MTGNQPLFEVKILGTQPCTHAFSNQGLTRVGPSSQPLVVEVSPLYLPQTFDYCYLYLYGYVIYIPLVSALLDRDTENIRK